MNLPRLFLRLTIFGRCSPEVHMLRINSAYSPIVGYAQILKKLDYPEILSYHLSHEKGCLRK